MRTCSWLLLCLVCLAPAQDAPLPDVAQVLETVRQHVELLESSVPNFVCKERIISSFFSGEKVKRQTVASSVLTTTRSLKDGHGTFAEARADMNINGKPSKREEIAGPFVWQGGPAYGDLHFLFNSDHGADCRTYKLIGKVQNNGKEALLLEARAAAGEQNECTDLPPNSADKIWLDPQSLNVLRVESVNPPVSPAPDGLLTLTVEYAPVIFDNTEYWLPSHFISRIDIPNTSKHFQYEAFFTDYHKYGAESTIHIDQVQ